MSPSYFNDKKRTSALISLCSILNILLPELQPNQSIFKSLNLKKTGGQGLRTASLGYAYIGNKAPNGETNEDKTKVQLLEEDVTER